MGIFMNSFLRNALIEMFHQYLNIYQPASRKITNIETDSVSRRFIGGKCVDYFYRFQLSIPKSINFIMFIFFSIQVLQSLSSLRELYALFIKWNTTVIKSTINNLFGHALSNWKVVYLNTINARLLIKNRNYLYHNTNVLVMDSLTQFEQVVLS